MLRDVLLLFIGVLLAAALIISGTVLEMSTVNVDVHKIEGRNVECAVVTSNSGAGINCWILVPEKNVYTPESGAYTLNQNEGVSHADL